MVPLTLAMKDMIIRQTLGGAGCRMLQLIWEELCHEIAGFPSISSAWKMIMFQGVKG